MNTAQDTFIIPDDIASGLDSGIYSRIGSVIRIAAGSSKGQIVKHLQPADTYDSAERNELAEGVMDLIKDNPGAAAFSGLIIGGIALGTFLYRCIKNRSENDIQQFRLYLDWYMVAEEHGSAEPEYSAALVEAYSRLKSKKAWNKVCKNLSQDELDALTSCLCRYGTVNTSNTGIVTVIQEKHSDLSSKSCLREAVMFCAEK